MVAVFLVGVEFRTALGGDDVGSAADQIGVKCGGKADGLGKNRRQTDPTGRLREELRSTS